MCRFSKMQMDGIINVPNQHVQQKSKIEERFKKGKELLLVEKQWLLHLA